MCWWVSECVCRECVGCVVRSSAFSDLPGGGGRVKWLVLGASTNLGPFYLEAPAEGALSFSPLSVLAVQGQRQQPRCPSGPSPSSRAPGQGCRGLDHRRQEGVGGRAPRESLLPSALVSTGQIMSWLSCSLGALANDCHWHSELDLTEDVTPAAWEEESCPVTSW